MLLTRRWGLEAEVVLQCIPAKKGNKNFFTEISMQVPQLGPEVQKHIMNKRYAYQDLLRGILEQGVQEGAFRRVNTRLATRTLLSIMEVLVYTTRPTGPPREMLADVLDIFMNGIES